MIATSDLLRVSLRQVIRQRSYGVICSIALGITAFITLSVLGQEIRYSIGQDMVLMGGVNVVQVTMDDAQYPGQPRREFYDETAEALRHIPHVATVSMNIGNSAGFTQRVGERNVYLNYIGIDEYFVATQSAEIIAGRDLSSEDVRQRRRVCLLGRQAALTVFGDPRKAVGQLMFLGNDIVEVVGVMSGVMLGSWGQGGFLPYTTMSDRKWGGGQPDRIFVRAVGWEDVSGIVRQIPGVVRAHQAAPYLVVKTQEEQLERIKTTFVWVEALLWMGIVAALMLGGFGIWYGTFAAVRARTREVGLKKAMGGSDADIMAQFLTEALCKSIAGGLAGIAVGSAVVYAGVQYLGCPLPWVQLCLSSIGSIVFSAVIGVAGGIFPALQASRMDVVSALRFE
ncbi:MAG: ABC transporter permease [Desulfovibrionaceae bacterium]